MHRLQHLLIVINLGTMFRRNAQITPPIKTAPSIFFITHFDYKVYSKFNNHRENDAAAVCISLLQHLKLFPFSYSSELVTPHKSYTLQLHTFVHHSISETTNCVIGVHSMPYHIELLIAVIVIAFQGHAQQARMFFDVDEARRKET